MEERLQKILARAGFGSRRACEGLILQGRVSVNGQVAQLGQKADPDRDRITLNGKLVSVKDRCTYVALYKPRGVLSDEGDSSGRLSTVHDLVPLPERLFPVGRLDLRSEGLILLTDDGDLTYRLTHPRFGHEKEYRVLVEGEPDEATLNKWRQGVLLEDRRTAPAQVSVIRRDEDGTWLRIVLREGRKRQIRRVAALLGYPAYRVIRVRIGPLRLGDLRPGQWRRLTDAEVKALRTSARGSRQGSRKKSPRRTKRR
jgi:23S rRNA pseudouridine2605 synthase